VPATDIVILADIPVEGRSPQQVDAQLRQKIHGFCTEVSTRLAAQGLTIKKATILTAEPGKCSLTIGLANPERTLEAQRLLVDLWNSKAWTDAVEENDAVRFERLVEELVDLGCSTYSMHGGPSYYWVPGDEPQKHPRAIEIGEELYRMGGRSLGKMREAAGRVSAALGASASNDLSWHWHEIGLDEWRQHNGECWMA
jgi:hypothetical protein